MDPHTAVAWKVAAELGGDAPVLIVSTAHWSKFAADVVRGLTRHAGRRAASASGDELALLDRVTELAPGAAVPASLQAVRERAVRFDTRVDGSREALESSLRGWLRRLAKTAHPDQGAALWPIAGPGASPSSSHPCASRRAQG